MTDRFVEPTALLPLRWGGYRMRYLGAVVLLFSGGLLMQATSVYATAFLSGGALAHLLGWFILPGRGWRRVAVAVPATLGAAAPLIGSFGALLLPLCLLAWLWVRERPVRSYPVLLFPVISALVLSRLFPQYGDGATVVGVSLAVLVGSAWLGRAAAGGRARRGGGTGAATSARSETGR
jgi:hypothetical protein